MYPEAGGSSSFARRAFNEFWSFFAAWGQMLNYVVTVAISRVLRPALPRQRLLGGAAPLARRHHRGRADHRDPGGDQRLRGQGVGRPEHRARGRRLPHPGAAGDRRRRARARRQPGPADRERRSRRRADVEGLHPRDPDRDDRLHGHRDDLEHGRGGQGRGQDDPGRDQARRDRGVRDLLHAAGGRAGRAAGRAATRTASYSTLLGLPEEEGGYAGDPIAGVVAQPRPRARSRRRPRSTSASSRRRSCSWPPTPA